MSLSMRILFILTELPYPASRNGLSLINYQLLTRAPCDCLIDLIITSDRGDPSEEETLRSLAPQIGKILFVGSPKSRAYRVGNLLGGAIFGRNFIELKHLAQELGAWAEAYSVVYACPLMIPYDLRRTPKLFLNAVDSFASLNANSYSNAGRMIDLLKSWLYDRYEANVLKDLPLVNFVSSADMERVRQRSPRHKVTNITNGVDADYFSIDDAPRIDGRIVFTGNFDYAPNAEAAIHLLNNIFPRVKEINPNASVWIVGRNPPRQLKGGSDIEITGFVDDIRPYYQRSQVFACPLLSGAGIKNKVLEAMSCGTPIVSTFLGVDGIDHIKRDVHYLLGETSEDFSGQVCKLLSDAELRSRISRDTRAVVTDNFSWAPIVGSYYSALRRVASYQIG